MAAQTIFFPDFGQDLLILQIGYRFPKASEQRDFSLNLNLYDIVRLKTYCCLHSSL